MFININHHKHSNYIKNCLLTTIVKFQKSRFNENRKFHHGYSHAKKQLKCHLQKFWKMLSFSSTVVEIGNQ